MTDRKVAVYFEKTHFVNADVAVESVPFLIEVLQQEYLGILENCAGNNHEENIMHLQSVHNLIESLKKAVVNNDGETVVPLHS